MSYEESARYSESECREELDELFLNGAAGQDVLEQLAPDGWASSPFRAVFHPSVEQRYAEALQLHENLLHLRSRDAATPPPPTPTLEEVRAAFKEVPDDPTRECRELVGLCLWDVFSDGHEVIAPDGRAVDFGSFRGSAGLIADWIADTSDAREYGYLDFYLGTLWCAQRADLTPVYEMIFHRLHARGLDWIYHFPRLNVIDLRSFKPADTDAEPGGVLAYDPSAAFAEEQEQREKDEQLASFRERLDEAHREALELASQGPLPPTVRAYHRAYGRLPQGWPPIL